MMRFLLSVLFLVFPCIFSETLMRKDKDKFELGDAGEIRRLHTHSKLEQGEEANAKFMTLDEIKAKHETCNTAYVLGNPSSDTCQKASHTHLLQAEMCIEAAREMGLPTLPVHTITQDDGGFYTKKEQFYSRPRGCYKAPCVTGGATTECLYFNKAPLYPTAPIVGTPVCTRTRLVNGTANSTGMTAAISCPADYDVIMNASFCEEAATCLGKCKGSMPSAYALRMDFEIGVFNRTEHDYFPQGCFIHQEMGCVFINPRRPKLDNTDWVPSQPQGTPICTVAGERGAKGFEGVASASLHS